MKILGIILAVIALFIVLKITKKIFKIIFSLLSLLGIAIYFYGDQIISLLQTIILSKK